MFWTQLLPWPLLRRFSEPQMLTVSPRISTRCKEAFGAQSPFKGVPALHGLTEAGLADALSRFAACCFHSRRKEQAPALSWETMRCWHRVG